MKIPSKEEIKSVGRSAMTKSHLSAKVYLFDGHSFELGWEQGAEWMREQLATPDPQSGIGRYGEMGRQFPYEDELRRLEDQQMKKEFDKVNSKDYKGANNEQAVHNISEFTVGQTPQSADVMTLEDDELVNIIWDGVLNHANKNGSSSCHLISKIAMKKYAKAKSDQLQAELEHVKSERDAMREALEEISNVMIQINKESIDGLAKLNETASKRQDANCGSMFLLEESYYRDIARYAWAFRAKQIVGYSIMPIVDKALQSTKQ